MSYNGNGTFVINTAGNPVVTDTAISSTSFNGTMTDIATGLSNAITRDGQSPATANIPMGSNKLTGLSAGNAAGNSLRFEQLFSQGTPVAMSSAATVDIGAQTSTAVEISGTVAITSLGTNYNGPRYLRFLGILTLTHSETLNIPGAVNVTTAAGDIAVVYPNSGLTGWNVIGYVRAAGLPTNAGVNNDITSLTGLTSPIGGVGLNSKIQSIGVTTGAFAMAVAANPLSLDFRSTTLKSGTITTVTGSPTTLIVPQGATLGTTSAQPSRIAILAINNAGTMELAVVNALGMALNETGLISTTAISAASASPTVVYSASARTGVAYRVLGFADSTQTTAGQWGADPSLVQGSGGQALTNPLTLGTAVATTSGVAVDFTGIPSWAKRITVMLSGLSTNGVSDYQLRIGSGSIDITGYLGSASTFSGSAVLTSLFAAGFGIQNGSGAANVIHGVLTLSLIDAATNKWVCSGVTGSSDASRTGTIGGSRTLAGVLDRLRLTTVNGTDTFDAGQMNIMYEG